MSTFTDRAAALAVKIGKVKVAEKVRALGVDADSTVDSTASHVVLARSELADAQARLTEAIAQGQTDAATIGRLEGQATALQARVTQLEQSLVQASQDEAALRSTIADQAQTIVSLAARIA